jgi:hypothetical protein
MCVNEYDSVLFLPLWVTKTNARSNYSMREVKATTKKLVALKNIYVVARMIWCNGEDVEHSTLPLLSGQCISQQYTIETAPTGIRNCICKVLTIITRSNMRDASVP